jgi:ATP-dependent Clp protease ATP-binding subunit ClpA
MFERFSDEGRQAVVLAQDEALELRHGWIGTEHLLLGLLRADGDGARLLTGFGIELASAREEVLAIIGPGEEDIDREALATLGIDLDVVRERVERSFGRGALSRRGGCGRGILGRQVPFTPRAKKALELTLREGIALGARELRGEHLVLGLLRADDGVAAKVLQKHGVALETARARVQGRDAA